VILGALADLYTATAEEAVLDAGMQIANRTLELMVTAAGVMEEAETIISQDAALFKGIFIRNLGRFARVLGTSRKIDPVVPARYLAFIARSVQSATRNAMTANHLFSSLWEGSVLRFYSCIGHVVGVGGGSQARFAPWEFS
jgi:predicted alpha-1,6-mannanase (GH76 family)